MHRTHTCGELRQDQIGKEVTLSGWVSKPRDHGGVIFIDLRDRYGLTQVVFNPDIKDFSDAEKLRREDVVKVTGVVDKRKPGMENPKLDTGQIEITVKELTILNKSLTPPIEVDDHKIATDDVRMTFRYLDLRRPKMQENFITRHKAALAARTYLNSENFLEIETPLLVKATPEGARDYIVPSRVNPGKAYALPQSPQLYKQILMASGFDRYYQLPRCLRDEDLRADRQPEFTQIDIEMSFVEQDDVFEIGEGVIKQIFKDTKNIDIPTPFPRLTYKESMERFGNDKPDLRFGLELTDVTDIVKDSDFAVFKTVAEKGGIVKCINPEVDISRKDIDRYIEYCQSIGAKGMAWMRVTKEGLESNIAKFFSKEVQDKLIKKVKAKPGSVLMFIADKEKPCNDVISRLRLKLGEDLNLIDKNEFKFAWIVDFPLFEWDEDEKKWEPAHHMFTMPQADCMKYVESDPSKVFASCYDMVLNGVELASGSIRIHDPAIQERVMKVVGFPKELAEQRFGFLLEAFKYGAPPHGGFAIGFDRLVAMIQGYLDIREVIAFPKNKNAECPMDGSPSVVDDMQLKELHIKLDTKTASKKNEVYEKLIEALNKEKIIFETIEHVAVFTSEEAAKVRGTKLEQGAKSLILKVGNKFINAVVSGAKEVDMDKLSKIIGSKVEMASAREVQEVTSCNIGSVPPMGNLFGLDVYIDESVTKNEDIAFNAGSHTKSVKMKASNLVKVTGGKVANFSK